MWKGDSRIWNAWSIKQECIMNRLFETFCWILNDFHDFINNYLYYIIFIEHFGFLKIPLYPFDDLGRWSQGDSDFCLSRKGVTYRNCLNMFEPSMVIVLSSLWGLGRIRFWIRLSLRTYFIALFGREYRFTTLSSF